MHDYTSLATNLDKKVHAIAQFGYGLVRLAAFCVACLSQPLSTVPSRSWS